MNGFDALGSVAAYTTSIALFKAVQSTSLSATEDLSNKHLLCFYQLLNSNNHTDQIQFHGNGPPLGKFASLEASTLMKKEFQKPWIFLKRLSYHTEDNLL